ncbi:DEAD/DEAH box helicase family protein [Domibacillus aminovorans]|uniref:DNA helicase n=1 Tax=Domibacillus aminovorans TaxID=29332 RepID=A0A177L5W9_9BACI|nr:DEAD/DEAH box helicase family protein [Domibacillus aminovorans]OAH60963.1 DNA helicase [Domibacillus aminovorans]
MSKLELITTNLIDTIERLAEEASEIYILTSFVMRSGVKKLLPALQKAANRGTDIHIGTGDYLHITQPDALQLFVDKLPEANVRMWQSGGRSFHPKAYLFRMNDEGCVIVGSSNMSASALTGGIEWNVSADDSELFETALAEFEAIFYHEHTIPVNMETVKKYRERYAEFHRRQSVAAQWTEAEEESMMLEGPSDQAELIVEMNEPYTYKLIPRPAQEEALAALYATMDEQYERALVVMATGLGKTYLTAFFAERFKRVLFIAHREEILEQAKNSFLHVHRDRTAGILNGTYKEKDADMIFASVFTLNSTHHLHSFQPDDFDLIVVDEFHHAASKSYEKIRHYFTPKFFLGITATPDRMDNKDVYSICDGNVAYRIHFLEAIQKQWLAPFHYYGVYDDTDYSSVTWLGTRYDEEELLAVQMRTEMANKILQAWLKHKQTRTIGFCSSIKQADFLSRHFNEKGYKTVALHSQTTSMTRPAAIKALDKGQLDIIFTVDLFNEGVDIPSVDTILFVRPTESLTVFTQQIGRGLRIADGKTHCVMIDLIGNYRNADVKMSVFDTDPTQKKKGAIPAVPENCLIDFELKAVELLTEMSRKRNPRKEQIRFAYEDLKLELGRRPTYLEFHLKANADSKAIKDVHNSYPGFLYNIGELNEQEAVAFRNHENWFTEVEKTGMNKSYKMVVLKYMLERGADHWTKPVKPIEIAPFFHDYLTSKEYRKRINFSDKQGKKLWQYDEKAVAKLIADMPMTMWSGSSNGLVMFDGELFKVDVNIEEREKEIIFEWTKEICKYRLHWHFERKAKNLEKLND